MLGLEHQDGEGDGGDGPDGKGDVGERAVPVLLLPDDGSEAQSAHRQEHHERA